MNHEKQGGTNISSLAAFVQAKMARNSGGKRADLRVNLRRLQVQPIRDSIPKAVPRSLSEY